MEVHEFDAVLTHPDRRGAGTFVAIPERVYSSFGVKGQVKVACEFDGEPYRGSIVNYGSGPCLGVTKLVRERLGKQAGDMVHVRLWRDEAERTVEVPDDLAEALAGSPLVEEAFRGLSYSHQREYVQWVTEAKRTETRASRVSKALEMISAGVKSPKA